MSERRLIEKVTVPEGERGKWKIFRFTVSEQEATAASMRAMFDRYHRGRIQPGTYTKLKRGSVTVMSDTPDEMHDHYEIVRRATGHVLINGLGLGMVLAAVLRRPSVERVTVVEVDSDVISLVGEHYASDRLEIINASAFDYQPPNGVRYGAVWHDIWDELSADNLPEMTKLKRKYGRRTDWQGCWGEGICRHHKRQEDKDERRSRIWRW